MEIDYAMLMASVANPGLLPLAVNSDRSTVSSANRTVRHKHNVEHSFKTGSGEELRGVAVDPARAVAAFKAGLDAIERFKVTYADKIDFLEKKRIERYESEQKKYRESTDKYERKVEEQRNASARVRELEKLKKNKFWGLSRSEDLELAQAKLIANAYIHFPSSWSSIPYIEESTSAYIEKYQQAIQHQLAQCAVAMDCVNLSPHWASAIYNFEQDANKTISDLHDFSHIANTNTSGE